MFDQVMVREAWRVTLAFAAILGVLAITHLLLSALWLRESLVSFPNIEDALLAVPALTWIFARILRRS